MPHVFRSIGLALFSLLACVDSTAWTDEPAFRVAAYLPDYRIERWIRDLDERTRELERSTNDENGRPLETERQDRKLGPVDDLIFFGMSAPKDGRFDPRAFAADDLDTLKKLKRETGCRLLFTVGGWGKSSGFPKMARDDGLREAFARDACRFCADQGLDGIDYDWEHPEGERQIAAYAEVLQATRGEFERLRRSQAEFAGSKFLVTVAQASWQDLGHAAYEAVDRVHLMSYDHGFPQATMEKSQADVERLLAAGCPREKILLGIPFYGRARGGDARTYAEIALDQTLSDSTDEVAGFAFNGPRTVAEKVRYATRERLGGVMIWEIGQDASGSTSLIGAIEQALAP